MAKLQTYKYTKDKVSLDFSFPEDANLMQNKIDFVTLLREALAELTQEIYMVNDKTSPNNPKE